MNLINFESFADEEALILSKQFIDKRSVIFLALDKNIFHFLIRDSNDLHLTLEVKGDEQITVYCPCCDFDVLCEHKIAVIKYYKTDIQHKEWIGLDEIIKHMPLDEKNRLLKGYLLKNVNGLFEVTKPYYKPSLYDQDYQHIMAQILRLELTNYHDYSQAITDMLEAWFDEVKQTKSLSKVMLRINHIIINKDDIFNRVQGNRRTLEDFLSHAESYGKNLLNAYVNLKSLEDIDDLILSMVSMFKVNTDYFFHIEFDALKDLIKLSYYPRAKEQLEYLISESVVALFVKKTYQQHVLYKPYDEDDYDDDMEDSMSGYENIDALIKAFDLFQIDYNLAFNQVNQALAIMKSNLKSYVFFEKYVRYLLNINDFETLREIINNPPEISWNGSEYSLLKLDYFIAINDIKRRNEQVSLIIISRPDLNTYKAYKSFLNEDEIQALLDKLSNEKRYESNGIIDILLFENKLDAVWSVIDKDPKAIKYAYKLLSDDSKERKDNIYIKHLSELANDARHRSDYKRVAYEIRKYKRITGNEIEPIIKAYKTYFSRRSAFVDELNKIYKYIEHEDII